MAERSNNAIPFEKHPLYQEAMDQIVAGDKDAAVDTLKRLSERYPDEQFLQDLLVRVQLQSTFGDGGEYIPVEHSQGTPILRTVVMVMLVLTTCLVVAAGLIAIYNEFFRPDPGVAVELARYDELWDDVEFYLDGGDLVSARQTLETLLAEFPVDGPAQQALEDLDQRILCSDMYSEASRLKERGELEAAGETASQAPQDCYNHERFVALLEQLEEMSSEETAWAEALNRADAGDWEGAITLLTWLRSQNQEFKTEQVVNLLFEAHTRVARELLDGARGDVGRIRAAASHLKEALTLKPGNQDILDEYRLAVGYVAGYEAYASGDWSNAVVRWEPLHAMRPDYQDGALREKLFESYPLAAEQLIAESGGSIMRMKQALDYFDRALEIDPGNEELQEEKELAAEYLAGNEAFVQSDFGLAISHWGPLHELRPDYLDGKLEENLRLACTQSAVPNEQYCTP